MLGVCEGIASMSMIVTEMQLNRAEKNVMIFSITTEEKIRQDFYCFHCEGAKPEDEIIVLSSLNDEKLACEGHQ